MRKLLGYIAAGIAFFVTMPSAAYAASNNEMLSRGDNNSNVMELQQALKEKGFFESDITGYFGDETYAAVLNTKKKTDSMPTERLARRPANPSSGLIIPL